MVTAAILKMSRSWRLLVVLLTVGVHLTQGQGGNNDPNYRNDEYWVDRLADCNSKQEHLLRNKEAVIRGPNPNPENQRAPQSCTIRLRTENNFEKTTIRIKIVAMTIRESQVTFSIYDGGPGQSQLDSYDISKGKGQAEFITTGNSVTFIFNRKDSQTSLYDIEVRVSSLVAGTDPGYENNFGKDYGYFNRQVPNLAIYSTVGAIFILVVIVIIIVGIVCHRKHKGMDKKPDLYKLSYINANISGTKSRSRGPISDTSTNNWVNTSRENLRREQRRHQQSRHSDDDSVFTADSYPEKKRYNPDHQSRSKNHRSDRHRSDNYRNESFIRADDDHPRETYIQREMSPRVKQRGKKYKEPEEEEDDQFDSEEEELSEEEEKEELTEAEEEEEEEDEEDVVVDADGPPRYVPERAGAGQPSLAGVPQPLSYPGGPGQMPMDPRQMPGPQPHSFPGDPAQMPAGPYGPRFMMYPGHPRPQFMPVAPGPGQFQPIHAPPPQAIPPPVYPGHQTPKTYEAKPSDPPVYSYLVQRGYNPIDGRDSPVSVSTNASGHSDTRLIQPGPDDHDMSSHNLGTGVEYMRR